MNRKNVPSKPRFFTLLLVLAFSVAGGCSDTSDGTPVSRAPTADLSEEITGASPPFIGSSAPAGLQQLGYVEREYVAAGTATSYSSSMPLTEDGRWSFEADDSAPYRTRILLRRPQNPADFSGTVFVEWLNVSGGIDANPEYVAVEEELTRNGHAWVGVSAQIIGVEGGPVVVSVPVSGSENLLGKGLKSIDPQRYATLQHPGDGYAFDMFTQVARALQQGGPPMGHMEPARLIAIGESQSAMALVTYYNGVQPLAGVFDGFFLHSRASFSLPLAAPGDFSDISRGLGTTPTMLRSDLNVPVLNQQAENDVIGILNSVEVRQPDSDTYRLWEVAGTAHADARQLGATASALDCGLPINKGPQHFVAKAALSSIDNWVRNKQPPPIAPRLELASTSPPALLRNTDGIAVGGVRTPQLDVPVDVLSGAPGPDFSIICILLGSTRPLSDERLAELYASRADYLQQYAAATGAAIDAGFVLEEERDAILADADPSRITP